MFLKKKFDVSLMDDLFEEQSFGLKTAEKEKSIMEIYITESNGLVRRKEDKFEPLITDTGHKVVVTEDEKHFLE